jgi:polyisoprenoid-binding protein YceI
MSEWRKSVLQGAYLLDASSAKLKVWTGTDGKAARAGHDLEIEVRDWSATVDLSPAGDAALALSANSRSLRVLAGVGGMQPLNEEAMTKIAETIDSEVLQGGEIHFRSTGVERADEDGRECDLAVAGELNLLGATRPVTFTLAVQDDGSITAEAVIRQTDFGLKPYAALFGALRVKDEVRVSIDGRLTERSPH